VPSFDAFRTHLFPLTHRRSLNTQKPLAISWNSLMTSTDQGLVTWKLCCYSKRHWRHKYVLIVCVKFEVLTAFTKLSVLIKEDAITSERSVHIYQTTRRHIPKKIRSVTSSSVTRCPNRPVM